MELESVKPRADSDEPPLPGWRMAVMPAAWMMASVTVTAPRSRNCSLLMISMLAGVSKGVSPSSVPVAAVSSSVRGGVSPDTEMLGRVATGAGCAYSAGVKASAVQMAARRFRTRRVLAEMEDMGTLGKLRIAARWRRDG
ncbi:hypothetical protein D3C85_906050 [compost metagenome]